MLFFYHIKNTLLYSIEVKSISPAYTLTVAPQHYALSDCWQAGQ